MNLATDAVLRNTDILHLVFSGSDLDKGTLFRAACVSRPFAEAALDVLWRDVHDFRHVLHLLSLDSVKTDDPWQSFGEFFLAGDTATKKFTPRAEMNEAQWARVYSYTRRIRLLGLPSGDPWITTLDRNPHTYVMEIYSPAVYSVLFERTLRKPLFPTLSSLIWGTRCTTEEPARFAIEVTKQALPRLAMLKLCDQDRAMLDVADMGCLLADVAQSTRLKRLAISTSVARFWSFFPLQAAAAQTELTTDTPPVHLYRNVESLAITSTLLLSVVESDFEWDKLPDMPFLRPILPALRCLSSSFDHASCIDLPFSCAPPTLAELRLIGQTPDVSPLLRAFDTLSGRFSRLEKLEVNCNIYTANEESVRIEDILRPLLGLRRLEQVALVFDDLSAPASETRFHFEDEDVRSMANAWPALRELMLRFECEVGPSIYTFGAFAQHCTSLRMLEVYCTMLHDIARPADDDDEPTDLQADPRAERAVRPLTSLQHLRLAWSDMWMADPMDVATFIVDTFPNADLDENAEFQRAYAVDADFHRLWQSVRSAKLGPGGDAVSTIRNGNSGTYVHAV